MITLEQIKNDTTLQYHHTAYRRGYISVKSSGEVAPYEGRFGKGYTIKRHNINSTQFCYIDYYITK